MTGATEMDPALRAAMARLDGLIRGYGPMIVACSGGVDSGLLAVAADRALEGRMLCVLGVSPSLSRAEEDAALSFFETQGLAYLRVQTHEIDDERYRANGPDRCFFCKHELFTRIESLPQRESFPVVAYGANADDRFDHRPGARAADSHRVCAPLAEAGFTKGMVRQAARAFELDLWDKPASPCLASRIPYQSEVTREKLAQIDAAEAVLRRFGFNICRVRHHGAVARIEVPLDAAARLHEAPTWSAIRDAIRATGFERVEVDERGFRSGRLNDALARLDTPGGV